MINQKSNILNSPEGMKSYLPETAVEFEEIKNNINDIFKSWGYTPIMTPTLERYDSLLTGMGQDTKKEFYKLIDYEGNILALKPEMTAPIARTVASRKSEFNFPLRLSYFAPVFRYDSPQMGKNREIYQMGLEFIGDYHLADAEVIIIAIEAVKRAGITDFKIDLCHTDYLEGIISELNLDSNVAHRLKSCLIEKDLVGLDTFVNSLQVENSEMLSDLFHLRGGKEVLEKAAEKVNNETSLKAIETLKELYCHLSSYEVEDYINIDLSLLRGLDYYTGVIFEGFTEKLGYTICGGGRYDNLIAKYGGESMPAVGFAIGLERIRLALKKKNYRFTGYNIDAVVAFTSEVEDIVLKSIRKMQEKGRSIIMKEVGIKQQNKESSRLQYNNYDSDRLFSDIKNSVEDDGKRKIDKIISFIPCLNKDEIEVFDCNKDKIYKIALEEGWLDKLWEN